MTPEEQQQHVQFARDAEFVKRLAANPDFIRMRGIFEKHIDAMKDAMITLTPESAGSDSRTANVLRMCSLGAPKDAEDVLRCMLALRAVVSYLSMQFGEFDKTGQKYDAAVSQLKEELSDRPSVLRRS